MPLAPWQLTQIAALAGAASWATLKFEAVAMTAMEKSDAA